jgi:hypothetical protein
MRAGDSIVFANPAGALERDAAGSGTAYRLSRLSVPRLPVVLALALMFLLV